MKKRFLLTGVTALLCLFTPKAMAQSYELRTLTFEDGDLGASFSGLAGVGNNVSTWSAMIASDQGGDAMLYGESGMGAPEQTYKWYDGENTELFSEFNVGIDWMSGEDAWAYWNGGHAISHYWSSNIESYGDYLSQLTVYRPGSDVMNTAGGGHNGSNNFAVQFGYSDDSGYGSDGRVDLVFYDGEARVIDHMYVCPTTYAMNCYLNGNGLTSKLSNNDYVKLIAIGYLNDSEVGTCEFVMANGNYIVTDWTKWDLYSLGPVDKVKFNIIGTNDNGFGFSQPAYFAYDDVAVRFPVATPPAPTSYERDVTVGRYGTICLPYAVGANNRSGATFYNVVAQTSEGIILEEETGDLTAGQAYIFYATATSLSCTYSGEAVATPMNASLNNGLQGTFEDNTVVPTGMCFLYNNLLWQSTGSNHVNANRAYLNMTYVPNYVPAPVPGRRRVVIGRITNEATGFDAIEENGQNGKKEMINGVIYINRNGRLYNAQGQEVK